MSGTAAPLPRLILPMLATLGREPFDDSTFIFEVKWDGIRCLAYLGSPAGTRLQSRRGRDITSSYPELANLHHLCRGAPAVLDGELVLLQGGRPSFTRLLARHRLQRPAWIAAAARCEPVVFVAFDLLYWQGEPIMAEPLATRRARLATVLAEQTSEMLTADSNATSGLVVANFVVGTGKAYAAAVFAAGLEGVMAKVATSPYLPGQRTRLWLKLKRPQCLLGLVAGFTYRADGGPAAVVVGLLDEAGRWRYAGKAAVSLPVPAGVALLARLEQLACPSPGAPAAPPPFTELPAGLRTNVTWLPPHLTAHITYLEATPHGALRHARFDGLAKELPVGCRLEQLYTADHGGTRPCTDN